MRPELEDARGNVWKLHLVRAIALSHAVVTPSLASYWKQLGVTQQDVFLLEAVFALSTILFALPNGHLADRFGRKAAILVGTLLLPIGQLLYGYAESKVQLAGSEMTMALAFSLLFSGDEALMAESLRRVRRAHLHARVWGRVGLASTLGLVLGNCVGGFLAPLGLRAPFWGAITGYSVLFVVALTLKEIGPSRGAGAAGQNPEALLGAVRLCLWERAEIRWLILFPSLIMGTTMPAFWMYANRLEATGVPIAQHAWIFAAWNLASGLMCFFASRLATRLKGRRTNIALAGVIGGSFILLSVVGSYSMVPVVMMIQLVRGFSMPLFASAFHDRVPSRIRSRALSVRNLCDWSGYLLVSLGIRALLSVGQPPVAFLSLALLMLPVGMWLAGKVPQAGSRSPPAGSSARWD